MEKKNLDQVESGSSNPTKSEELTENEGQEISSSEAASGPDFNSIGDVQKTEDDLKGVENEEQPKEEMERPEDETEDFLNLSPEDLELAEKALSIELILSKILENLPSESLVNFRLVNKTWEIKATDVIMKESKTQLRFRFDWRSMGIKINNRNLSDLNECIRKSRRFPCSYYYLPEVPFRGATMKAFFTLHGKEVKRLGLELCEQQLSQLGDVLLDQMPNIQRLLICGDDEMKNNPARLFPENSVLPHLKSFSYYNFPSASEIIRASPKLEKVVIKDNSYNGIEALKSMNKIHLLKQVWINNDYENIPLLKQLADGNPKLEKIVLGLTDEIQASSESLKRRFANALSKILESSKETLTNVSLSLDEALLVGVKWQCLENVRDLRLRSGGQNRIYLPANFISRIFPNTRTLRTFYFQPSSTSAPFLNCAIPLTHLAEYQDYQLFPNENLNLDNLSLFAPNLRKVYLSSVGNFAEISDSLWACSGLKELNIQLLSENNSFPHLDMAFTGLSEEIVRKLHGDPNYFNEMKKNKNEIPRIQRSILDCPGLTALTVRITSGIRNTPVTLLMTAVSGEFGFKMLENLGVEIKAEDGTLASLDSLKPYAKLSDKGWW